MIIIHVTGHRPKQMGHAYDIYHPTNIAIGRKMREFILEQAGYNKETNTFANDETYLLISGMALGIDTIWALVVIKLKNEFPGKFMLECAIPCKGHADNWPQESQDIYYDILKKADIVTQVSDKPYAGYLMQKRNIYMVDKAHMTLAIWKGSEGGTGNCVNYAKECGKPIYVIHPFTLQGGFIQ